MNFLMLDIPLEFAPDPHGDESQMAGNGRVMRGLDGRDSGFAGFDAIEKISPVVVGNIQFLFGQINESNSEEPENKKAESGIHQTQL